MNEAKSITDIGALLREAEDAHARKRWADAKRIREQVREARRKLYYHEAAKVAGMSRLAREEHGD